MFCGCLGTDFPQLVVEMRECLLGLEQMLNSRCCLGIRIKLLTLPMFQLDTVLSSQELHEATYYQKLGVQTLQTYLKPDEQASSRREHVWLQITTTERKFRHVEFLVVDKKVIPPNPISTQSITQGQKILGPKISLLKGQ